MPPGPSVGSSLTGGFGSCGRAAHRPAKVFGYPPGGVTEVRSVEDGSLAFTVGGCYTDISLDGRYVAAGGCGVNRYVDVHRMLDGQLVAYFYQESCVHDVASTPDNQFVAGSGRNNQVYMWNIGTEALERIFGPHENDVSCIALPPDGTLLAAGEGGRDSSVGAAIRLWNLSDGTLVRVLEGHGVWVQDVAFSPDGSSLISSGRAANSPNLVLSIRIWRVSDNELLEEFNSEMSGGVSVVNFSPDGVTFAYARGDGTVLVASSGDAPSSVAGPSQPAPSVVLGPPEPNPVSTAATIDFRLKRSGPLSLTVHDASGRFVALLAEEVLAVGEHRISWNGRDCKGRSVPAGVYFLRLSSLGEVSLKRLLVVR